MMHATLAASPYFGFGFTILPLREIFVLTLFSVLLNEGMFVFSAAG